MGFSSVSGHLADAEVALGTWFSSGLGSFNGALMGGLEEPFPTKTTAQYQELSLCPFGVRTGQGGRSVQCKGRPVR